MQLEIGGIYEAKVKNITKFGAFVNFEDGQSGMVHISEVSNSFVNDISEFLTEGQDVKVKVLTIAEDGKIGLSIKQADENYNPEQRRPSRDQRDARGGRREQRPRQFSRRPPEPAEMPGSPGDFEWRGNENNSGDFEDMMSKFKTRSDEKISELKKANDVTKGYSRRGKK